QLEDVSHLDAAHDLQPAAAVGARVPGEHVPQVGHLRLGEVAPPVDAGEVKARLVRAADEIAHRGDGAVGDHAHALGPHRAYVARLAMEVSPDLGLGSKAERIEPCDL